MPTPAVAPDNLPLPEWVLVQCGHREQHVLDQGFDEKSVGPEWWAAHLAAAGLDQEVRLAVRDESAELRRCDLFRLGRTLRDGCATDGDVLTLLWHVLAWGTGPSQRGNARRIESFANHIDRDKNLALLRRAAGFANEGDVRSAYSTLVRRGGGKIRGLGPAFFTKFLYFASEGAPGSQCLILDARVAERLKSAGWCTLPGSVSRGYSYNWFTDTYVSYCDLAFAWAEAAAQRLQIRVWPDEIERALFGGQPSGRQVGESSAEWPLSRA